MEMQNLLLALLMGFGVLLVFAAFTLPQGTGSRYQVDENGLPKKSSIAEAVVINSLLADLSNRIRPQGKSLEDRLRKSGWVYATPAEYHSRRMIAALVCVVLATLVGLLVNIGILPTAIVASLGAVVGFTMPDRAVSGGIKRRQMQLLREMGFGLDRIALLLGSGANISDALANTTGVGLFGEVCAYISSAIKTSQPINDVIVNVQGSLPELPQLNAFLELIRVGIIQGQELTGPFRSMAEMMRQRLRLDIVETGQKAKIKVVMLTSGFIVVATMIVTIGPALQALMGNGLF